MPFSKCLLNAGENASPVFPTSIYTGFSENAGRNGGKALLGVFWIFPCGFKTPGKLFFPVVTRPRVIFGDLSLMSHGEVNAILKKTGIDYGGRKETGAGEETGRITWQKEEVELGLITFMSFERLR